MRDLIVAGGGPAGMMAAIMAARNDKRVCLIEKNDKLGKKLFITGKGRCNFTNAVSVEGLLDHVLTNKKFLFGAFYSFDSEAVIDFFEELGLKHKVERGGRVFPASDHSSDVIKALEKELKRLSVEILLNTRMKELVIKDGRVCGVMLSEGRIMEAENVILALGGNSYRSTGSNGEGNRILKDTGLKLIQYEPSLVPFEVSESFIGRLAGLSLKNISLKITVDGKKRYEDFGELLFTHTGLSGPVILSASCNLREEDYKKKVEALIDLKPALSEKQLDQRLLRDFSENINKKFANSLGALLPSKLIPVITKLSGIDADKPVNSITKTERKNLCMLLKSLSFSVKGNRGFDEAIITRGGVSVKELDPSSMKVKKLPGLSLAGEMIDTDAYTGGFNLQIAWATGALAGMNI